jgi:hypothetical protein
MFLTDRNPWSTAVGQQIRSALHLQPTPQSVTDNKSRSNEYTPPPRGKSAESSGPDALPDERYAGSPKLRPALRSLAPRGHAHRRDGEVTAWTNLKGACPEGR